MAVLDESTFLDWANKILERIDSLHKTQAPPRKVLYDETGHPLWDNFDLCQELHVSMRTLQRYRDSGTLPYQMIYHKTYYREADIREFIRTHFSQFKKTNKKL